MIGNINAYEEHIFKEQFPNTELYKKLSNDFDTLSFEWNFNDYPKSITPRQRFGDKEAQQTRLSVVPFYYINYLLQKNPDSIADIGCGWNIFAKYIPQITGYDVGGSHYNILMNNELRWLEQRENTFESLMSINALNYHPLTDLEKILNLYFNMLKPGGRGYIALNIKRMVEKENIDFPIEEYIRKVLTYIDVDYVVIDLDLKKISNHMDGNLRLVADK